MVIENSRRLRRSIATAFVIATAGAPGGLACAPQRFAATQGERSETAYMDSAADQINKINDAYDGMLTLMEEYAGKPYGNNRYMEAKSRTEARATIAQCESTAGAVDALSDPPEKLKAAIGLLRKSGREFGLTAKDLARAMDTEPPVGSKWDMDRASEAQLQKAMVRETCLKTAFEHYDRFEGVFVKFMEAYGAACPNDRKWVRRELTKYRNMPR